MMVFVCDAGHRGTPVWLAKPVHSDRIISGYDCSVCVTKWTTKQGRSISVMESVVMVLYESTFLQFFFQHEFGLLISS